MPCLPVARHALGAADVGPHFQQAGELWWYLAVMTPVTKTEKPQSIGVQLSVFRKDNSGECTDSADNLVVSTAAIAHGGNYYQATRLFPKLTHATLRAQPYALNFDDGRWGVSSVSNSSSSSSGSTSSSTSTPQRLVASGLTLDGSRLSVNLSMTVPSASVLMADRGFADLNGTLLAHYSKPRSPATGTITFGGRSTPLHVRGDVWLQHLWFSTGRDAAFPQWNWFYFQLANGWNFQMVALGNGTHAAPGDCLGGSGSYGNLVEPKSGRAIRLSVGVGADVCYRVLQRWTDPRCPGVHYPIVSAISIRGTAARANELVRPRTPQLEMVISTLQNDNIVRPPFPRLSGYCAKAYYEGASRVNGTFDGESVDGVGFTEHEW